MVSHSYSVKREVCAKKSEGGGTARGKWAMPVVGLTLAPGRRCLSIFFQLCSRMDRSNAWLLPGRLCSGLSP